MDTPNRFFIAVLEGPSPTSAHPVLSSGDSALVEAFARALANRLGVPLPDRVLRIVEGREQ